MYYGTSDLRGHFVSDLRCEILQNGYKIGLAFRQCGSRSFFTTSFFNKKKTYPISVNKYTETENIKLSNKNQPTVSQSAGYNTIMIFNALKHR